MHTTGDILLDIFRKAALCRAFEEELYKKVEDKTVSIPVYLSAGQEYIPATIATALEHKGFSSRQVFIQHRGHSTYLSFGGNIDKLILELLGRPQGCAAGMGGSASIQSTEANIIGHDGLMGSHGPIAVGMCYANRIPTICFVGDAAAEEDYFLSSIGWASTKKLPILFVVEDNNLSIMTEKKVRRNWEMHDLARAFKMDAWDIEDDPEQLLTTLQNVFERPMLLNVRTNRLFWHAGAGIDSTETFDRHKAFSRKFDTGLVEQINTDSKKIVGEAWKTNLNL